MLIDVLAVIGSLTIIFLIGLYVVGVFWFGALLFSPLASRSSTPAIKKILMSICWPIVLLFWKITD